MVTAKNHSGFISKLLVTHVLSGCLFVIRKGIVVKVLKNFIHKLATMAETRSSFFLFIEIPLEAEVVDLG